MTAVSGTTTAAAAAASIDALGHESDSASDDGSETSTAGPLNSVEHGSLTRVVPRGRSSLAERVVIGIAAMAFRLPPVRRLAAGSSAGVSGRDALSVMTACDAPVAVPLERWDMDSAMVNGLSAGGEVALPPRFGAWLPAAAEFDAAALGVSSASEAALMDPQQRLLLESLGEAMISLQGDAASSGGAQELSASERGRFGVYVGISSVDYMKLSMRYSTGITPYSATGGLPMGIFQATWMAWEN